MCTACYNWDVSDSSPIHVTNLAELLKVNNLSNGVKCYMRKHMKA